MKSNIVAYVVLLTFMVKCSSQYLDMTLENDMLCSVTGKKRKIKLGKGPFSGLIVRQVHLGDHNMDWDKNFRCRFQVSSDSSRGGVIAVIQHLIFRKNSTTDECIDYLQFIKKDGSSSQKFCGRFNSALHMDHNFVNPTERVSSGTAVVDERGDLETIIFLSKEKIDGEMNLTIVFTEYKHCSYVSDQDPYYRPCSRKRKEFCIYTNFFSDSLINCPLPDCVDENGCIKHRVIDGNTYGNKVLIGALSGVSIMFAIFILTLWICKTYKIFCWSQSFANPTTTPHDPPSETPRVIELDEQISSIPAQGHSSNVNRIDEDKDLPPSYDSLFPAR